MAARESVIQASCIHELEDQGAWVTKNHQSGYTRKGIPDIGAVWCGVPIYLEVKASATARVRDEQIRELHALRDAGAVACIVSHRDHVRDIIMLLLEGGYDPRAVHEHYGLPPMPAVVVL